MVDTPPQKRLVEDSESIPFSLCCLESTRRIVGGYGLLNTSSHAELGNSRLLYAYSVGRENASEETGGQRQRSSRILGCNSSDMAKVCQGIDTIPGKRRAVKVARAVWGIA